MAVAGQGPCHCSPGGLWPSCSALAQRVAAMERDICHGPGAGDTQVLAQTLSVPPLVTRTRVRDAVGKGRALSRPGWISLAVALVQLLERFPQGGGTPPRGWRFPHCLTQGRGSPAAATKERLSSPEASVITDCDSLASSPLQPYTWSTTLQQPKTRVKRITLLLGFLCTGCADHPPGPLSPPAGPAGPARRLSPRPPGPLSPPAVPAVPARRTRCPRPPPQPRRGAERQRPLPGLALPRWKLGARFSCLAFSFRGCARLFEPLSLLGPVHISVRKSPENP